MADHHMFIATVARREPSVHFERTDSNHTFMRYLPKGRIMKESRERTAIGRITEYVVDGQPYSIVTTLADHDVVISRDRHYFKYDRKLKTVAPLW